MNCTSCGAPLSPGAHRCPRCGAPVPSAQPAAAPAPNVRRGPDGVYRWIVEMSLLRNPTVLITVFKVLGLSLGITYLLLVGVDLFSGSLRSLEEFWAMTWPFLILAGVLLALGGLAYLIVAALYGGKYVVLFEMTETELRHIQLPRQVKMGQALGILAALSGLAGGNLGAVGLGLSTAARGGVSTSVFRQVKSLSLHPRRGVIKLRQSLSRNQVYALPPDFPFVAEFIRARCPQARVKDRGRV